MISPIRSALRCSRAARMVRPPTHSTSTTESDSASSQYNDVARDLPVLPIPKFLARRAELLGIDPRGAKTLHITSPLQMYRLLLKMVAEEGVFINPAAKRYVTSEIKKQFRLYANDPDPAGLSWNCQAAAAIFDTLRADPQRNSVALRYRNAEQNDPNNKIARKVTLTRKVYSADMDSYRASRRTADVDHQFQ